MRTAVRHTRFLIASALLFVISAVGTAVYGAAMPAMGMPMPGGWTMSMTWMRMPGQTWPGATAAFLAMWIVMMAAMMLPALVPMLWRYRQAVGATGATRLGRLTTLAGAGYFFVWAAVGLAVFALGGSMSELAMRQPELARVEPLAAGGIVLLAGVFQFTGWKTHHLACCRTLPIGPVTADAATAWRHGLRLGLHCVCGSAGLTTILLVIGVMDLRAMAVVAGVVTLERLAPSGERVARAIGTLAVAAGAFLITVFLVTACLTTAGELG